jgi:hypothetical protein
VTDQRSAYDDGQLPWLQAVDDEDEPRGVSARKMLAALAVVLLAALLIAATFFWLGRRDTAVNGPPELIQAPPGPYKIKPPKEQPKPGFSTEAQVPAKPEPKAEPTPPTVVHGSVIQLGAFANQAQAERAWTALSSRFPSIAGMGKMIVPFSGGIRLRATAASPAEAKEACQRLKAAGENCFVAQ